MSRGKNGGSYYSNSWQSQNVPDFYSASACSALSGNMAAEAMYFMVFLILSFPSTFSNIGRFMELKFQIQAEKQGRGKKFGRGRIRTKKNMGRGRCLVGMEKLGDRQKLEDRENFGVEDI